MVTSICQCQASSPYHFPFASLVFMCLCPTSVCVSVSALQIGSFALLFWVSHICINIYLFFSFDFTLHSFFFFVYSLEPHMMVKLEIGKRSVCILQNGRMEFANKDVGKGPHSKHRCISGRSILRKTEWKLRIWKPILLKAFTGRAHFLASHSNVVSGTEMTKELGVRPRWC